MTNEDDVYSQLLRTARNCGLNVIGRNKAANLLALCYAFGDEPFVFSKKLYVDTMEAARVLSCAPMKLPSSDTIVLITKKYKQIMENKADWIAGIEEEYGVKFPEWKAEWKDGGLRLPESVNRTARWSKSKDRG